MCPVLNFTRSFLQTSSQRGFSASTLEGWHTQGGTSPAPSPWWWSNVTSPCPLTGKKGERKARKMHWKCWPCRGTQRRDRQLLPQARNRTTEGGSSKITGKFTFNRENPQWSVEVHTLDIDQLQLNPSTEERHMPFFLVRTWTSEFASPNRTRSFGPVRPKLRN